MYISTNSTRLYNAVFTYYHTIVFVTSKNCIVAIKEYKGEFHHIIYFKIAVVFIVSGTAVPSCCSLFFIYHIFFSFNRIFTLFRYSLTFHFCGLTNTKVSGYFDLTNTTTQFVHHVEYRLLNLVLHFIAI